MTPSRRDFIQGLRDVADFYQHHPLVYDDEMHLTLSMYVAGPEARSALLEAAKAFGHCNKTYDERTITLSRPFGPRITLAIFALRERICRRVITGERILPARVVPATNEVHIPARREPLVVWECDPLLDLRR